LGFNESVILYHPIYGPLMGYAEFYALVSSRAEDAWVGTGDFGLIYQVTPNLALDVDTFIGLTRSAPDYVVLAGVGIRF
jgi:ABC-type polysaccharide transport system permease subunit